MKMMVYFFILLSSFFVLGQKKDIDIKVFLEDAYTGKKIKDAKVTLEGFEIPEIVGNYDKKGKFYYFSEIPEGYNTVMAYHKDYNEKGFHDLKAQQQIINLKLYYTDNVSYTFERPVLTNYKRDYSKPDARLRKLWKALDKKDTITDNNFRYLYAEDPYHIAIISKYNSKDFLNDRSIADVLEKFSLVAVNSLSRALGSQGFKCYGFDRYGNFFGRGNCVPDFNYCDNELEYESGYKVYFYNKKDKTKFSRYHSPEIEALRKLNLVVAALTVRRIEYFADRPFDFEKFYNASNLFQSSDTHQDIDDYYEFGWFPPVQVFFSNARKDNKAEVGKSTGGKIIYDNYINYEIYGLYFVIPKSRSAAVGLGGLEIMESGKNDFMFFNVIPQELTITK